MDYNQKENFKAFCHYLGLGTINSKIWFVGIEEGGQAVSELNISEQLENCRIQKSDIETVSGKTQVWNTMSKLIHEKYFDLIQLNYQAYRDKLFNKDFPYFFSIELLPLPRPNNSSWPEDYPKLFGYKKTEYSKYLSDVRLIRYPDIYKNWIKAKPSLTICYGKGYWNEFIDLFGLADSTFEKINGGRLKYFPKENVILSYFFSNRSLHNKDNDVLRKLIAKV